MGLSVVTEPTTEPVTLTEAKAHLRVDASDDDTLITSQIKAARAWCEAFTRRAFITQTWDLTLDAWPECGAIEVPLPPLQSVTSITYVDTDGNTQTWNSSKYLVDIKSLPGRITPTYTEVWPVARDQMNAITIRFVCGWADANAVPETVKQGLKLLLGHLYERRESTITGTNVMAVPMATESLLWPYRCLEV